MMEMQWAKHPFLSISDRMAIGELLTSRSILEVARKIRYGAPLNRDIKKTQETTVKLFDSHCHLDDRAYAKDLDKVLARAAEAGVAAMMVAGTHVKSSRRAVEMAREQPGIIASVGIHPHDVARCHDSDLSELITLAQDPKVRAWGEIGLDFNRMYSPREDQEKWLVSQLRAADDLGLPVIFHERDSQGRLLQVLRAHPNPARNAVVHCFSGTGNELDAYLEMGFYIGITGIVTIETRGAALRDLVPRIPLDRILVETDAPYLTPAPEKNRTQRNEPAFVRHVLARLAAIRGEEPQTLAEIVWENTCRLFRLSPETFPQSPT
jgi:TatD DNase family protein